MFDILKHVCRLLYNIIKNKNKNQVSKANCTTKGKQNNLIKYIKV